MDKISLNIKDRVLLPGIFPVTGSLQDQIAVKAILEKVKITEDEALYLGIKKHQNGEITWQQEKIIEVEFSKEEIELLKGTAHKVDEQKLVTQDNIELIIKLLNYGN